jgi:hypothetical protein
MIVIGILPATIGNEVPHSNRSLLALPGFVLATVWLLEWALNYITHMPLNKKNYGSHGEKNMIAVSLIGCLILAHSLFFTAYMHNYFTRFAAESADAFKDGYLELFEYLRGKDDRSQPMTIPMVSEFVITDYYGQPYIYALFAKKLSPMQWNGGALVTHLFKDANVGDLQRPNAAVVATPMDTDLPLERANHIIYGSDGQPRFYVFLTNALR